MSSAYEESGDWLELEIQRRKYLSNEISFSGKIKGHSKMSKVEKKSNDTITKIVSDSLVKPQSLKKLH